MSYRGWFFLLCLTAWMNAQDAAPKAPAVDSAFVQAQFGSTCDLVKGMTPVEADLNGDGVMDMVIPARCTNPMIDQAEHSFRVIDPYNTFFGYGNPKVTSQFVTNDAQTKSLVILVIHGIGADTWHSSAVKEKYVMINMPYKQINVRKAQAKKKERMAIFVSEADGNQSISVVYWDGKQYKYEPIGSTLE